MLRLLYNDIRLNAVWFFWVFLLLNLEIILTTMMFTYPRRYGSLSVGLSFAMSFPLVLILREEYWKGHIVNRSLPVTASRLVTARYLSVYLLGLASAFYGWSYQGFIEFVGPHASLSYYAAQMEAGYAIEHSLIARSLGLCLTLALAFPLVLRFGSVWRIIIGYVGLRVIWGKLTDYLLGLSLHATIFLGLSRWVFFVTVFIIAIIAMSVRCSIWLYRQREF